MLFAAMHFMSAIAVRIIMNIRIVLHIAENAAQLIIHTWR